ncbi:glycosyltransferase family 4 protein [Nitratireductor sp. GCM10026969]|uniref:glycosyltransferase family 4 protein n=1 Tax=Nitratireductor sp. GCM10026969 TaxID=3252645 RepID=UPI00361560A8
MKIAFVLSGLAAGGAEKIVNLIAHHRLDRGDTIRVFALNAADPCSYFPYSPEIGIEPLGGRRAGSLRGARVLVQLRRRLAAFGPDLVISFLTKINTLTGLTTLGLPTRIVMSERNNFLLQRKNPLWRLAGPIAARRSTFLVMQTEAALSALPAHLRTRAVVIPNPVTLREETPPAPSGEPGIVAVGRLERQKGFDLLIAAFRRVADDVPTTTLTIFGEGPERAALEQQARDLGLRERVRLPGVTTSPAGWIRSGNIFVLSSRFEGFPNVLLEALAAGMATVAFDCLWGPAEILTDGAGILVPAGDTAGLGEALRRVALDDILRSRLAATGRAVAERYSQSTVLAQWDDVILRAAHLQPVSSPVYGGHTGRRYRTGP